MTLYNCMSCRRWHNGNGHICGEPMPAIRDQRSLERAVVRAARKVDDEWANGCLAYSDLKALHDALLQLDGLDRPLLEGETS